MEYIYKCDKCSEKKEITIPTLDIIGKEGRVDQLKLSERMYEKRICECGGELKKIITTVLEPMWFNCGIGKGKISSRFK